MKAAAFGLLGIITVGSFFAIKRKENKIQKSIREQEELIYENAERMKRMEELHKIYFKENQESNLSKDVQNEEAKMIDEKLKHYLRLQQNIRDKEILGKK